MLKLTIRFAIAALLLIAPLASHARDYGIAAIVNDSAITTVDVNERLALAMKGSGINADDNEARKRFLPQVVQLLIDEELIRQEAAKQGIKVKDSELREALASIATKNHLRPDQLDDFFASHGIDKHAITKQVTAQILRAHLLRREVRPQVVVTDQDVEEKMENIAADSGKEEFHLAEIVLPVDRPEDEETIRKLSLKLSEELQKGAAFDSIARQFSRSTSAANGGDLGWIAQDQLSRDLRTIVGGLKSGENTQPLRLADGYHLLQLKDRRAVVNADSGESEVGMRQLFLPLPAKATEQQKLSLFNTLDTARKTINGCENVEKVAKDIDSKADPKMVMVQLKTLNKNIRSVIAMQAVGTATPVIKSDEGMHVFVVCERTDAQPSFAQKEHVRELLLQNKMELQSRRFLQDLRRNSYVEIKLQG